MIGTDIVSIDRIKAVYQQQSKRFVDRILTENERSIFQQRNHSILFLANRFAAKEAVAKALGTGIAQGITFQDIEILPNERGAPEVTLYGAALTKLHELNGQCVYISLSDEKEYAVAFASIR